MKENKKLVSEIIKDIQHDMSDEEILLREAKFRKTPKKKQRSFIPSGSAPPIKSQNLREAGHLYSHLSECSWHGWL